MILLIFHVAIALTSLAYATILIVKPSEKGFTANWVLIGLTVLSGTALAVLEPATMLTACKSGLAYLVVVATESLFARNRYKRLSAATVRMRTN